MKRLIQHAARDKTWAEKIPFALCRCDHANTIHAGGFGGCGVIGCKCPEFKERITPPDEPPKTFQDVKKIMEGT